MSLWPCNYHAFSGSAFWKLIQAALPVSKLVCYFVGDLKPILDGELLITIAGLLDFFFPLNCWWWQETDENRLDKRSWIENKHFIYFISSWRQRKRVSFSSAFLWIPVSFESNPQLQFYKKYFCYTLQFVHCRRRQSDWAVRQTNKKGTCHKSKWAFGNFSPFSNETS